MTLHQPEGFTFTRLLNGFDLKTVIVVCAIAVSAWYSVTTRIAVDEIQQQMTSQAVKDQQGQLSHKVDIDQYAKDQARMEADLGAIRASEEHIEEVLMERGK